MMQLSSLKVIKNKWREREASDCFFMTDENDRAI